MASSDGVKVCIRVRPFIKREAGSESYWENDTHHIKLKSNKSKSFAFDRVFGDDESTGDVYEEIAEPIVQQAMMGFNGTVFAYGQTSSGKTYTMFGETANLGIIPRAVNDVFDIIEKTPKREFLLRVSYLEIYNENLKDLLATEFVQLQIREDEFKNVKVSGLCEHMVRSPSDVMTLMQKGDKLRRMASTNMNSRSSRSHTIFRLIIESRERLDLNGTRESDDTAVMVAQLNMVDLAGSERAGQTGAEGVRLKEGCFINKSLTVLGQVINQICKESELGSQGTIFKSFRDSKLTRILQTSLGGNSLTAIICTATVASIDQTESTLRFASSAKQVKNKPKVNEVLSDEALLYRQKREIDQLKKKIHEMQRKADLNDIKQENIDQKSLLDERSRLIQEQEEKLNKLKRMLLVSSVPADISSRKQLKSRRETWCPGAMAPPPKQFQWQMPSNQAEFTMIENSTFIEELDRDERMRLMDTPSSSKHGINSTFSGSNKKSSFENAITPLSEYELQSTKEQLQETLESNLQLKAELELLTEELKSKNELLTEAQTNSEKDGAFTDTISSSAEICLKTEKQELEYQVRKLKSQIKDQDHLLDEVFEKQRITEEEASTEKKEADEMIYSLSNKIVELEKRELERNNGDPYIRKLKGENENLQEQLRQTCRENRRLLEQCDEDSDQMRSMSSTVEKLVEETSQKDSELENFKNQVSSLQSQLESSMSSAKSPDYSSKLEHEVFALKKELEEKTMFCTELFTSVEELKNQIETLKEEHKMELELQTSSKDDGKYKENVNDTSTFSVVGCEKTSLMDDTAFECEMLTSKNKEQEERLSELLLVDARNKQEIADLQKETEHLSKHALELQEQLEFDKAEKEIMFEEEQNLRSEINKLKEQLTSKAESPDNDNNCKNEIQKSQDQRDTPTSQVQNLRSEINKLKEQLTSKAESPDNDNTCKNEIQKSQDQRDTPTSQVRDGEENRSSDLEKKIIELERESRDAQELFQDVNMKLSQAHSRIEELEDMIKSDKLTIKRITSDLESYEIMSELSGQKSMKSTELERSVVEQTEETGDDQETLKNELLDKISALENQLEENNQHVGSLEGQLNDCRETIKNLQSDLESRSEEIRNAELSRNQALFESESSREQSGRLVEEMKSKLEDVEQELDSLKRQAESDEYRNSSDHQIELQKLVDQLQLKSDEVSTLSVHLEEEKLKFVNLQEEAAKEIATSQSSLLESFANSSKTDSIGKLRDELALTRKENVELLAKNKNLVEAGLVSEKVLLAENNKELRQQRQLNQADQLQKDVTQIFALERNQANVEISALKTKLEETCMSLSKLQAEKDIVSHQLAKENADLKEKVVNLERSLRCDNQSPFFNNRSSVDSHKLEAKIKQLNQNADLSSQRLMKLDALNKDLKDEIKQLQYQLSQSNHHSRSVDDMNKNLQSKDLKIDQLRKEVERQMMILRDAREDSEHQNKSMAKKIDEKQSEIEGLVSSKKHCEDMIQNYEEKKKLLDIVNAELKTECDNQKFSIEQKIAFIENLQRKIDALKDELASSKSDLADAENSIGEKLNQIQSTQNEVAELNISLATAQSEKERLARENENMREEITSFQHRVQDIDARQTEVEDFAVDCQKVESLEKLLIEKEATIQEMNVAKQQQIEKEQQFSDAVDKLESLEKLLIEKQDIIQQLNAACDSQTGSLDEKDRQFSDAVAKLESLEKLLIEKENVIQQLNSACDSQTGSLDEKDQQFSDAVDKLESLEKLLIEKENEIQQLNSACDSQTGSLDEKDQQFSDAVDKLESLEKLLIEKENVIQQLNSACDSQTGSLDEKEKHFFEVAAELESLKQLLVEKQNIIRDLKETQLLQNDASVEDQKLIEVMEKLEMLGKELWEKDDVMRELTTSLSDAESQIKSLQEMIEEKNAEFGDKHNELEESILKMQRLEQRLEALKSDDASMVKEELENGDNEDIFSSEQEELRLKQRNSLHSKIECCEMDLVQKENTVEVSFTPNLSQKSVHFDFESEIENIRESRDRLQKALTDLEAEHFELQLKHKNLEEGWKSLEDDQSEMEAEKKKLVFGEGLDSVDSKNCEGVELMEKEKGELELEAEADISNAHKIADLESEINELKGKLVEHREVKEVEVAALEHEINELRAKLADGKEEAAEMVGLMEREKVLQTDLSHANQTVMQLRECNQKLEKQRDDLSLKLADEEKLSSLSQESLEKNLVELENENNLIKTRITDAENEKNELKLQLGLIETEKTEFKEKYESLIAKCQELEETISDLAKEKEDIAKELAVKNDECETQVRESDEIENLREDLDVTQLKLRRKTEQVETLKETLSLEESRTTEIQRRFDDLSKKLKDLEINFDEVRQELESQKSLTESKQQEIENVSKNISELKNSILDKENEIKALNSDLVASKKEGDVLMGKVTDLRICLDEDRENKLAMIEAKDDLSEVEKNFITVYYDYQQLITTNEGLTSEVTFLKNNVYDLENASVVEKDSPKVDELQKEIEMERNKSDQLQSDFESVNSKLTKETQKVEAHMAEISDLKSQVIDLEKEVYTMNIPLMESERKCRKLESEIAKLEQKVEQYRFQLEEVVTLKNASHEEQILQLKKKCMSLENELALKVEIIEKTKEETVVRSKDNLSEQVKEWKKVNLLLLKEKGELEEKLAVEEEKISELTLISQSHKIENEKLKNKIKLLEEEYEEDRKSLQGKYDELTKTTSECLSKDEDYEGKLAAAKAKLNEKALLCENLNGKLEAAKTSEKEIRSKLFSKTQDYEKLLIAHSALGKENRGKVLSDASNVGEKPLQSKQEELKEALCQSTKKLREKARLSQLLQEKVTNLEAELRKISSINETNQEIVLQMKEKIENLKQKQMPEDMATLKEHLEYFKKRDKGNRSEIERLEKWLYTYEKESETYKSTIEQLENQIQDLKKNAGSGNKNLGNNEVFALNKKMETDIVAYLSQIKSLKVQLETKESSILKMKEQMKLKENCNAEGASTSQAMTTRSTFVGKGGIVQLTKFDILEKEMHLLKLKQEKTEAQLAKYKNIEVNRRAENVDLLEENNKFRRHLRKLTAKQKEDASKETSADASSSKNPQKPKIISPTLRRQADPQPTASPPKKQTVQPVPQSSGATKKSSHIKVETKTAKQSYATTASSDTANYKETAENDAAENDKCLTQ